MGKPNKLFPPIKKPYNAGFLNTDDGHQVYFEECGNPKGKPIVFIPGGPGAGCEPKDRRWFNPKKWRIILRDLRGSGRSRPTGKIENNTTQHTVEDTRNILKNLGIEKAAFFGGSWGSTEILVYSITYPETVTGLMPGRVFLGERDEIKYYIEGKTTSSAHAREAWMRFMKHVPPEQKNDPVGYYYHQLTSPNAHRRMYFGYEWVRFESSILHKRPRTESEIEKEIYSCPYEAWALMEAHYFAHNCFLEDKFIINNADKIPNVPITIVHGEHDEICPPINARRLHEVLPTSVLHMVKAGHSSSEPAMIRKLIAEVDELYDKIS